MEANTIDVREWLAKNKQMRPFGVNQRVQEVVHENLEILIPRGIYVKLDVMNVFGFGVERLCSVESVLDIDWVDLINLAAGISTLWNTGFIK